MNKKGFTFLWSFMMAVAFFFIGLALAPALSDTVHEATNGNNSLLNCTQTNLTTADNITCTQLDMFTIIIIGLAFGMAGAVIGGMI